jgi:NhaP-type Na+/H+ or K+/H+ antiporter
VLAVFKEVDADENLFAIVFGESIFNDAVAIVMY